MNLENFTNQFAFNPERHLFVGIERECFLTRDNQIAPIAPEIVPAIDNPAVGYELSACQLETRVGPIEIRHEWDIEEALGKMQQVISDAEKKYDFKCKFIEVAPDNMPLDIYPDPRGRYQKIVSNMPQDILLAACQVTGTHIHIGVRNHQTAIEFYNHAIRYWQILSAFGDNSDGQRLKLYRKVAPLPEPKSYRNWEDFYQSACKRGFSENPRNCWDLIRISVHGTIEFRMFGSTNNLLWIDLWAKTCHTICKNTPSERDWFADSDGRRWSTHWHG